MSSRAIVLDGQFGSGRAVQGRCGRQVLDAAGLSLFAVSGAGKALDFGMGPGQRSS